MGSSVESDERLRSGATVVAGGLGPTGAEPAGAAGVGWAERAHARRSVSGCCTFGGLLALALGAAACDDGPEVRIAGGVTTGADAGAMLATGGTAGAGAGGTGGTSSGAQSAGDAGEGPSETRVVPSTEASDAGGATAPGAPVPDVSPAELAVDVFGTIGNSYWIDASEPQVALMNAPYQPANAGPYEGDLYSPLGRAPITFADHLFVTAGGDAPHTADFGKVQLRLIGQSTGRPWTVHSLPNFKIDSDEFIAGNRVGGVKHLRLNNGVSGNIFREKLALDLYRALGYPAPRAIHAWVSGSVWGPDVRVPYVAIEAYKPQFCKLRTEELGGGCVNMWEFSGDLGSGALGVANNCQFSECDPARGLALEAAVAATPHGDGYQAALADWLDWNAFHRFQCLSWILQTGDDALHNLNNLVIVERVDGKFQLLPYSVDLAFGQTWPREVRLGGHDSIAAGCQSDSSCWAETIATCEQLVADYGNADPVGKLDALYAELSVAGMLRPGDDELYQSLRGRLAARLDELPIELEANRASPVGGSCAYPLVPCGDTCVEPGACPPCEPPADAGAPPTGGGQACLP